MLADPLLYKPGPVDILLGAKEYQEILLNGIRKTNVGLTGQNTEFGWILFGSSPGRTNTTIDISSMMTRTVQDNDITKFWELEEVMLEPVINEQEQVIAIRKKITEAKK